MPSQKFHSGSPGVAWEKLLRDCPIKSFLELFDTELRLIYKSLDINKEDFESAKEIALSLCDPRKLLSAKPSREKAIGLLPIEKARELLVRLGYQPSGNPYPTLESIPFDTTQNLDSLYAFFGLIVEERVPFIEISAVSNADANYPLFIHQRNMVKNVVSVLSTSPYKCLMHMPTGAGKTRTAMHIICRHFRQMEPTIVVWLAQTRELLDQALTEFQRAWQSLGDRPLPIYKFYGDKSADLENIQDGFLVAGFAKMYALYQRNPNMIPRIGDRCSLLIIDEAHQSIAPTYKSIAETISRKRPHNQLLGLSATPGRTWNDIGADVELSEFFGGIKVMLEVEGHSNPVEYLISEGYLANPTFTKIITPSSSGETEAVEGSGEYGDDILEELSRKKIRNKLIIETAELLLTRHKRVLLFAASVFHANLISAVLKLKGIDSETITADTPSQSRTRILTRYKSNDETPKIICNFGVLTTGFDAPKTSAALIARPTRSLVLYSQMIGRAIRGPKQGGNSEAEIFTVVDPELPGFGDIADAFLNWEDVWN